MKVLIVDDSVVFRSQIKNALQDERSIEVVGSASNGRIAVQKLQQEKIDLITLDLEMPEMNGMETLAEIKRLGIKVSVIVFSSQTQKGAETALEALANGASDVVAKPTGTSKSLEAAMQNIKSELVPKVLQFSHDIPKISKAVAPTETEEKKVAKVYRKRPIAAFKPKIVVIGSSTGGPDALEKVFTGFNATLRCPILIAQHMPPVFTKSLADRLSTIANTEVVEATQMETVENKAYIAPGDYHMSLVRNQGQLKIKLDQREKRHNIRPAADFLFETAAELFKSEVMSFVLTGMGEDALQGAMAIKEVGGGVMIQDKASCVVFGMPGAIFDEGCYDVIGPLEEIRQTLQRMSVSQIRKSAA